MTITFPRGFPEGTYFKFNTCEFRLVRNQAVNATAGGQITALDLAEPVWSAKYKTPLLNSSDRAIWQAWCSSLKGALNGFFAYDPEKIHPLAYGNTVYSLMRVTPSEFFNGRCTITSAVAGTDDTPATLNLTALPASYIFSVGDHISVPLLDGTRSLHQVITAATSSGAGTVAVTVEPNIDPSNVDSTAFGVYLVYPSCIMVMRPGSFKAPADGSGFSQISFEAVQNHKSTSLLANYPYPPAGDIPPLPTLIPDALQYYTNFGPVYAGGNLWAFGFTSINAQGDVGPPAMLKIPTSIPSSIPPTSVSELTPVGATSILGNFAPMAPRTDGTYVYIITEEASPSSGKLHLWRVKISTGVAQDFDLTTLTGATFGLQTVLNVVASGGNVYVTVRVSNTITLWIIDSTWTQGGTSSHTVATGIVDGQADTQPDSACIVGNDFIFSNGLGSRVYKINLSSFAVSSVATSNRYAACVTDGTYVYFLPYRNNGSGTGGRYGAKFNPSAMTAVEYDVRDDANVSFVDNYMRTWQDATYFYYTSVTTGLEQTVLSRRRKSDLVVGSSFDLSSIADPNMYFLCSGDTDGSYHYLVGSAFQGDFGGTLAKIAQNFSSGVFYPNQL